jgi:hypothetical protein
MVVTDIAVCDFGKCHPSFCENGFGNPQYLLFMWNHPAAKSTDLLSVLGSLKGSDIFSKYLFALWQSYYGVGSTFVQLLCCQSPGIVPKSLCRREG